MFGRCIKKKIVNWEVGTMDRFNHTINESVVHGTIWLVDYWP